MATLKKIINNHPMFHHADDLNRICSPLSLIDINYFSHVKITNCNEFSALSLNPEFGRHYLMNHYYNADVNAAKNNELGKYVIWDNIELAGKSKKLYAESIQLGVDHTFTIVDASASEKNFYHFASNIKGRSINQEYLTHLELLNRFIDYFNEKVAESPILSKAYHFKIAVDETSSYETNLALAQHESDKKEKFLAITGSPKPIPRKISTQLTYNENRCLALYIAGYSAKEISKNLGLSFRTVENYISHIKEKLRVRTKTQLILLCMNVDAII
jgi:DNA-binding CsgD family transcriptional regulator